MYIPQRQLVNIRDNVNKNKVLVIYGPRQCGKTTLLNKFLETESRRYLFVSGEDIVIREQLSNQSIEKLRAFVGNNELLDVDEAQKISEIGLNLKLIVDHVRDVAVIATGSSSFDLARGVGEPLTGRKITFKMFPLSQMEIAMTEDLPCTISNLESRLIYGSYPEVVITPDNEVREIYLRELVNSYLLKDVLELDGIRHSDKIIKLLRLLSFQIGKDVSYSELGGQLGMSKNTVERYLDLLEKSFVIFSLKGFSKNLRKEISKASRYYFCDVGIRNALINNFNPLSMRNDVGMLWENYVLAERLKKQEYQRISCNNYFWRTYDKKEIDLVEEREGRLYGYEIKWGQGKVAPLRGWLQTYSNSNFEVIDKNNYLRFIT